MKTAEEWLESNRLNGVSSDSIMIHISELKQIQLDAIKEGMRRARDLFSNPDTRNYTSYNKDVVAEINEAAEQLTEKDL